MKLKFFEDLNVLKMGFIVVHNFFFFKIKEILLGKLRGYL
jgi:hypothetical protein